MSAARTAPGRSLIAAASAILVGHLAALAYLLARHTILAPGLENDSPFYLRLAQHFFARQLAIREDFAVGYTPSPATSYWPPFYPLSVAAAHALAPGTSWMRAGLVVSAASSVAALLGLYALARAAKAKPSYALLACALTALSHPWLSAAAWPSTDMLFTAELVWALVLLLKYFERPRAAYAVLAFTAIAFASQTRYVGGLFMYGFFALCLLTAWRRRAPRLLAAPLLGLCIYFCLQAPWKHICAVYYTGYGISPLFIETSRRGDLNRLNPLGFLHNIGRLYPGVTEYAFSYYALRPSTRLMPLFIANARALVFAGAANFFRQMMELISTVSPFLFLTPFAGSGESPSLGRMALEASLFLGVAGFAARAAYGRRKDSPVWMLGLLLLMYMAVLSMLWMSDRYLLPVLPFLCVLLSLGLEEVGEAARSRKVRIGLLLAGSVYAAGLARESWRIAGQNISREDSRYDYFLADHGVAAGSRVVGGNYIQHFYADAPNVSYPPPWTRFSELEPWLAQTQPDYFVIDLPADRSFMFMQELLERARSGSLPWARVAFEDEREALLRIRPASARRGERLGGHGSAGSSAG